jgi:non-ribosomal peptide synthetase component E (peptide arylation enzyme)
MIVKAGRTPRILPFPMDHIERTDDGVLRYTELVPSLVHLLRATVERAPTTEALVELGGERLTYQEVWDRATRVAGGLRDLGIGRGDRVGIRLPNGNDWALAFFGTEMLGAVAPRGGAQPGSRASACTPTWRYRRAGGISSSACAATSCGRRWPWSG